MTNNIEHADNVEHADHADNVGSIVVTPPPRSRLQAALEVGKFATMMLLAASLCLSLAYLVPSNRKLVDDIVEARAVRQQLQEDLAAERAEDELELRQDECEEAYARAITRATDARNQAEDGVFGALLADDDGALAIAREEFRAAADAFSTAVQVRDAYVAEGSPLPCPLPADG